MSIVRNTPGPKWQAVGWRWFGLTATSSIARPGGSVSLKVLMNVGEGELGKPVESRIETGGIWTAKDREDSAGMGCWSKQKPRGNHVDRTVTCFVAKSSAPKGGRLPTGPDGRETPTWPAQEVTLGGGATH